MADTTEDIIDALAGIAPGSALEARLMLSLGEPAGGESSHPG